MMLNRIRQRIHDVRTISALCTGAQNVADKMGEQLVGAEHMLLAALDLPDGSARQVFEELGAEADGFGPAIALQYKKALIEGLGIDESSLELLDETPDPITDRKWAFQTQPSAKTLFQRFRCAGFFESGAFVSAEVIVAITSMENGIAIRALRAMEVDLDALRKVAVEKVQLARVG